MMFLQNTQNKKLIKTFKQLLKVLGFAYIKIAK
jgi:hypothetical protein